MTGDLAASLPRTWRAWPYLRAEIGATLWLALPLAATQLGQILIHGTEVVLLGRLGPEKLASVTLAWALFYACFIFATGVVQATAPMIATARGAHRPREARRAFRQGLWVALVLGLPFSLLLWHSRPLLEAIGQDPALLADTETYLRAASFGLPLGVGFIVVRNFVSAHNRTMPIVIVTFATLGLNVVLSWALIFGELGMPRLEVMGAGIGAAASWAMMFVALLAWCVLARPFRRLVLLGRLWRPDWATFREIWRIGLPIGAALLLETTLFGASALLVGYLSAAALAAHQVTLQLAATSFMVPLGIGIAATIRVGLAVGAGDADGVRRAGWIALLLGGGFMVAMGILFWLAGPQLVGLFFDAADPASGPALALAGTLISIAALFQLADGLQVIGLSVLRGLKDTAVPMWLAGLGYWLIGLPACVLLGFTLGLGAVGIWLGLALALTVVAAAMVLRFVALTRRGVLERTMMLPR